MDTLMMLAMRRPSRARLEAFRARRVQDLIPYAHRHVPYYRRLFDAHGVRPEDVRGVRDLARVPMTSRQALQALAPEEIVARATDPATLVTLQSSGSTGRPLVVRRTWWEERVLRALRNRVGRRMGRRPWETGVRLVIPERIRPRDARPHARVLLPRLGLYRDRVIDCLAAPQAIIAELRAVRPKVIGGFPPVLVRVARHAGPGGLGDLGVRALVVGGEVMTPAMRRRIEEAFRAPVYESYGSIELNVMAWTCTQTGLMHVCDEGVVLEVLRDGRPVAEGEVGEVVVTGLHSRAMPIIRYAIGDLAMQGPRRCPCGAPWTTIGGVHGRMLDYFPLPDGRVLHPYELTTPVLSPLAWIEQYQLTQERTDRVVLRIVARPLPGEAALAELRRQCEQRLGPAVTFEVQLVDELPLDSSGKFRAARSLVPRDGSASSESAPAAT